MTFQKLGDQETFDDKNHFVIIQLSAQSHRWEVLVQIERQWIEFLTPTVTFERPELFPPMFPSVFPDSISFLMYRVVQEISNNTRHKCFRLEWHIHYVIELPSYIKYVSVSLDSL